MHFWFFISMFTNELLYRCGSRDEVGGQRNGPAVWKWKDDATHSSLLGNFLCWVKDKFPIPIYNSRPNEPEAG